MSITMRALLTPTRTLGRLSRSLHLGAVALAVLVAGGCSLHFADNGSALPASAKTIYVERFENVTYVPGINDQFARYLKDSISSHGRLTVVDNPQEADLVLSGKIVYAGTAPGSLNGVSEPLSYGNTFMVAATLTDRKTNAVVWRTNAISAASQASIVAQAIVPTTPHFLNQGLRGPQILQMSDMQVAASQQTASKDQMMREMASELYADMAWGL